MLDFGQTSEDILYECHRPPSMVSREPTVTPAAKDVPVLLRGLERLQTASWGLGRFNQQLSFGFRSYWSLEFVDLYRQRP